MLKSFIKGSIMTDIPNHLLEKIGKDTATLHNIKPPDDFKIVIHGREDEESSIIEKEIQNPKKRKMFLFDK